MLHLIWGLIYNKSPEITSKMIFTFRLFHEYLTNLLLLQARKFWKKIKLLKYLCFETSKQIKVESSKF